MANRSYAPELTARLAMADSEARAAVESQANAEGAGGDQPDSDDDPMRTPGSPPSTFILRSASASVSASASASARLARSPSNFTVIYEDGADDLMDIDEQASIIAASEATTDTDMTARQPENTRGPLIVSDSDEPSPQSDRENVPPPIAISIEAGPQLPSDLDSLISNSPSSWSADMNQRGPQKPVKKCLPFPNAANDPTLSHLREISGLASWTVSSYKPGCGVPALLAPSTASFWQSDGPQPHLLNIHFFKLVRIVKLRVYLDFELDESYTPTRLSFAAGTHDYDAVEFADWKWDAIGPKGWIDVDLSQCGSDEEREREQIDDLDEEEASVAGVLRCFFLQIRVLENHQNGKDTHLRGVQIFARDERVQRVMRRVHNSDSEDKVEEIRQGLLEAHWMSEPELR